jgi:hypothetical protein
MFKWTSFLNNIEKWKRFVQQSTPFLLTVSPDMFFHCTTVTLIYLLCLTMTIFNLLAVSSQCKIKFRWQWKENIAQVVLLNVSFVLFLSSWNACCLSRQNLVLEKKLIYQTNSRQSPKKLSLRQSYLQITCVWSLEELLIMSQVICIWVSGELVDEVDELLYSTAEGKHLFH